MVDLRFPDSEFEESVPGVDCRFLDKDCSHVNVYQIVAERAWSRTTWRSAFQSAVTASTLVRVLRVTVRSYFFATELRGSDGKEINYG
jgi:hypothetical protein